MTSIRKLGHLTPGDQTLNELGQKFSEYAESRWKKDAAVEALM